MLKKLLLLIDCSQKSNEEGPLTATIKHYLIKQTKTSSCYFSYQKHKLNDVALKTQQNTLRQDKKKPQYWTKYTRMSQI